MAEYSVNGHTSVNGRNVNILSTSDRHGREINDRSADGHTTSSAMDFLLGFCKAGGRVEKLSGTIVWSSHASAELKS